LNNVVKIFNKVNPPPPQKDSTPEIVSDSDATEYSETSSSKPSVKPEEVLKDAKGIILNMASKTKAMNDTRASQQTQSAPDQSREAFLKAGENYIAQHKQIFEAQKSKFEKSIANLPESPQKNALIKEFNDLKAIVESDDLVKAAEPLKPKEGQTNLTLPQIELAIVGNYTKVLGVENPFTQGDIKSLSTLTYQFDELAKHDPAASPQLKAMKEVITSYATACDALSADYKLAANKENPIPLDPNKVQELKDMIQQLRTQLAPISFDKTTPVGKTENLVLAHLRVRLGIAEKRLNELSSVKPE